MDDKVLLEKVSIFHCVLEIEFPGRRGLDRIPRWGMGWHQKTAGNVSGEPDFVVFHVSGVIPFA